MKSPVALLLLAILPAVSCPPRASAQAEAPKARQSGSPQMTRLRAQLQEHLHNKQISLAIADLQSMVKLDPSNAEAHGNLGVLLYFQGNWAGALPELRAALRLHPDIWKLEALLGLAEMRAGDVKVARDRMERAFPHIEEANIQSEVAFALADSYVQSGENEKAAASLSALLTRQPTNPVALYRAYRIYSDLADKSLITLGMVAPASAEVHVSMGRELARQNNAPAAISNYRQAASMNPRFPGLHAELGRLLFSSEDAAVREQAISELEQAIAENPNDEQAHLMLGLALQRGGKDAEAEQHFKRAVELSPEDSDACTELGKVLSAKGDTTQAMQLFERAVTNDVTNYAAHYRLSMLYRKAGRTEEAKREVDSYKKYKQMHETLSKIFDKLKLGVLDPKGDEDATPAP